eukprot:4903945-Prymnesium_polylepis.1
MAAGAESSPGRPTSCVRAVCSRCACSVVRVGRVVDPQEFWQICEVRQSAEKSKSSRDTTGHAGRRGAPSGQTSTYPL